MTPDFVAPDPRDSDEDSVNAPDDGDVPTTGSRVKNYDGLIVDPAGNPHTIGADSSGD